MDPRGIPPPRRSSSEGRPVGRRWRVGVEGEGRVPIGAGRTVVGVRRVNEGCGIGYHIILRRDVRDHRKAAGFPERSANMQLYRFTGQAMGFKF